MEMAQGAPRQGATPGRGSAAGPFAWSWDPPGSGLSTSLAHPLILWIGKNTALVAQNGIEMGHFETRPLKSPTREGWGEGAGRHSTDLPIALVRDPLDLDLFSPHLLRKSSPHPGRLWLRGGEK